MTYYYTIQHQELDGVHWSPFFSGKWNSPMEIVPHIDAFYDIWKSMDLAALQIPQQPIRIAVFKSDTKKRVDQMTIGTLKSLYQYFLSYGSLHLVFLAVFLESGYSAFQSIVIDT